MTYEEMHAVAQYLYQLLDDIDTATDMAKADDKLYRGIVERTQAKKSAVVAECDGYTVTLRPLPANVKWTAHAPHILGLRHVSRNRWHLRSVANKANDARALLSDTE